MIDYLLPLQTAFEANANPDNAAPMKRYMREQFEFLGLKAPLRRSLIKEFYAEHGPHPSTSCRRSFSSCGRCPTGNTNTVPWNFSPNAAGT